MNPRTNKRGEHVWDNWLNREAGKQIYDPSTTYYYGLGGDLIRQHDSVGLDVTLSLVCDQCNNGWMSDLTTRVRDLLEPSIRRDQPVDLDAEAIVTLTSYAFMKSALLDWHATSSKRVSCLSRSDCLAFCRSLTSVHLTASYFLPTYRSGSPDTAVSTRWKRCTPRSFGSSALRASFS